MSIKILVVDDSNTIRQQLTAALTKASYKVIEADNGLTGLQQLKENRDIALIISDFSMPIMNGFEMIVTINSTPDLVHPPVLMLTADSSTDVMVESKKLGAKGIIIKPFKPENLIEIVNKLLKVET